MVQFPQVLAKSDGLSLEAHLGHVAEASAYIAPYFGLDRALAYQAGWLHDIGKVNPHFQARLAGKHNSRYWQSTHSFRHEIASLLFLPLFPESQWEPLAEMVVAHHKSVDEEDKGLFHLLFHSDWNTVLQQYTNGFADWKNTAIQILTQALKLEKKGLDQAEIEAAFQWLDDWYEAKNVEYNWNRGKGLLMAADHLASAIHFKVGERLPLLFKTPKVSRFEMGNPLFPLSNKPFITAHKHTLVIAPTGAGKTNYLMRRCTGRVFYVLPFQASIDAMTERLQHTMPENADSIFKLHAASHIPAEGEEAFTPEIQLQPMVGAAVKVLTPFQIAAIALGTKGFESQLLDLEGCDVVLDEIHTYDEKAMAIVKGICRSLLEIGCRLHIGTATMPGALYHPLKEMLGSDVLEVHLTKEELQSYDRHVVHKCREEKVLNIINQALSEHKRVLWVCNTVSKAQENYRQALDEWPDVKKMLIHSRFRRMDRKKREKDLKEDFAVQPGPCLVVSTQVVEVSLDISFDVMVTDCAPIDSLIQRFGRVNRKRLAEAERYLAPVYVVAPEGNGKPYNKNTLEATYQILPDGAVLATARLQEMIDAVYPQLPETKIEDSLIFMENGGFKLKALCHNTGNALSELLEFEGDTAILESDLQAYKEASWIERKAFEIPVRAQSIKYGAPAAYRLKGVGAEPHVIDQAPEQYELFGLRFDQPDTNLL